LEVPSKESVNLLLVKLKELGLNFEEVA